MIGKIKEKVDFRKEYNKLVTRFNKLQEKYDNIKWQWKLQIKQIKSLQKQLKETSKQYEKRIKNRIEELEEQLTNLAKNYNEVVGVIKKLDVKDKNHLEIHKRYIDKLKNYAFLIDITQVAIKELQNLLKDD